MRVSSRAAPPLLLALGLTLAGCGGADRAPSLKPPPDPQPDEYLLNVPGMH